MGFPSQCAAAFDQVDISECMEYTDVREGVVRDGKLPW